MSLNLENSGLFIVCLLCVVMCSRFVLVVRVVMVVIVVFVDRRLWGVWFVVC